MVYHMEKERSAMQTEPSMKEIGLMEHKVVKAGNRRVMVLAILDSTLMINLMALEFILGQMGHIIKDNGSKTKCMEQVSLCMTMDVYMKVNG